MGSFTRNSSFYCEGKIIDAYVERMTIQGKRKGFSAACFEIS